VTPLLAGVFSYLSAGVLSFLYSRFRFRASLIGWFGALAGTALAIARYVRSGPLVRTLGSWGALGIEIKLDETTLLFASLAVILNFFTLWYLRGNKDSYFYCIYNFLFATSFSVAFSHDLFNLYVTIELMSLLSILLIGYGRKGYQIYAGIKYLLISSLAMSLYLIGLGLVYREAGYLGIEQLGSVLGDNPGFTVSLGLGLMLVGLAVKGGIFLFSMWLPDAYSYSGTVAAVVLSGIATKFGLIGIIRLAPLGKLGPLLLVSGSLTGLAGAVFAILGRRPKRILAYSTMSQVGYVLIGVGTGAALGVTGASLHLFFHGLFKGLLFLSLGHAGIVGGDVYGTISAVLPRASKVGLVVGSLSIMAIPPFSGYFSKNVIVQAGGGDWVRYVLLFLGLATAIYYIKLNWFLLAEPSGSFAPGGLPLLGLSAIVAFSGLVTAAITGEGELISLLGLKNILSSVGVVLAGGAVLGLIRKPLRRLEVPGFVFDLNNALISLFTGILLIASFIAVT